MNAESCFQEAGESGFGKWGNEVSNINAMLSIAHQKANVACLKRHASSLPQQTDEVAFEIHGELARGGVGLVIGGGFTSVAGNDRCFAGVMRLHDDALVGFELVGRAYTLDDAFMLTLRLCPSVVMMPRRCTVFPALTS